MTRIHIVAFTFATAVAVAAVVDTVILAVTGERTWLTDDQRSTALQNAIGTFVGAGAYLSQALVVRSQRTAFDAGNGLTRRLRVPLMTGLVLLALGALVVHPLVLATDTTGPLLAASDAAAGLALLITFGSAVLLGLSTLRDNPLGIGARVLACLLPTVGLTILLGLVARDVASPIFLSVVAGLGLALLGVRRAGARPHGGRRAVPASLS